MSSDSMVMNDDENNMDALLWRLRLNEYFGTQALHTKTILVGDRLSMVGSCNLDMRSVYLDTEMMLFIESEGHLL